MSLSPFSRGRWPVYRVRKSHIVLALALTSALFVWSSPPAKAFSQVGALTLNAGENRPSSAVIDSAAGFAYFGTSDLDDHSSASIIKIRLSDFSRVDALKLNAGENIVSAAAIDPDGGFAYFGTYTEGFLSKISLSDFTIVDTLQIGQCCFTSVVIDPPGGFVYFASALYVFKIYLSNFTIAQSPGYTCANCEEGSAVADSKAGFAYFGGPVSSTVAKVRLSDLTVVDEVVIGSVTSAVIDSASGFAYFGSGSSPGTIYKVETSPTIVRTSAGYTFGIESNST